MRIIAQRDAPAGAMVKIVNKDGKIGTADLGDTSNPKESSDWVYTNTGVKSWKKNKFFTIPKIVSIHLHTRSSIKFYFFL